MQIIIKTCFVQALQYKVVLGSTGCKLCTTKYFVKTFCVNASVSQAFWRAEETRWVETSCGEVRKVELCSDEMKIGKQNLADVWEEMKWDEKSSSEVRRAQMKWDEMRWAEMRWDEVWNLKCGMWSVSVKCEARGVKIAVCSVNKVFAWRCIAPGPCAGHVLWQQQCNSFAHSTHARAWLAHRACKFYRWQRFYSISLRQLPPRLVRVLLVPVGQDWLHHTMAVKIYLPYTDTSSTAQGGGGSSKNRKLIGEIGCCKSIGVPIHYVKLCRSFRAV